MNELIEIHLDVEEDKVYVKIPYSKSCNTELQRRLDTGGGSPWCEERNCWQFRAECYEEAEEIVSAFFPRNAIKFTEA